MSSAQIVGRASRAERPDPSTQTIHGDATALDPAASS
jgi:hypothetical protein